MLLPRRRPRGRGHPANLIFLRRPLRVLAGADALWTRQIVAALIEQRFGVRLGVTAVGRLLADLDITPQKPLRRAYERDPAAIARWTTTVFPRLRARAKRVGATIFFLVFTLLSVVSSVSQLIPQ